MRFCQKEFPLRSNLSHFRWLLISTAADALLPPSTAPIRASRSFSFRTTRFFVVIFGGGKDRIQGTRQDDIGLGMVFDDLPTSLACPSKSDVLNGHRHRSIGL